MCEIEKIFDLEVEVVLWLLGLMEGEILVKG